MKKIYFCPEQSQWQPRIERRSHRDWRSKKRWGTFGMRQRVCRAQHEKRLETQWMLQLWVEPPWNEMQTPPWLHHQQTSKQRLLHLQKGRWLAFTLFAHLIQSIWVLGCVLLSCFVSWFHKAMIVWTDSSCTMATSRERGLSREWTKWKIKQSKQIFCLFMLWMAHTSQNMKDYFDNSVFLFRCWKECASSSDCCSYEYSPSVKMCNLNKKCEPEEKKVGDFLFCKKLKKPWVVNKIHVQFTAE